MKKFLWNFRNALLDYKDDFDEGITQARLEQMDRIVMPDIYTAKEDNAYILRGIAHFRAQQLVRTRASMFFAEIISSVCLIGRILKDAIRKPALKHDFPGYGAYLMLPYAASEERTHMYKIPQDIDMLRVAKKFVAPDAQLTGDDWHILGILLWKLIGTACPWPVQYLYKAYKDLIFSRSYIKAFPDAHIGIMSQEYSCSISLITLQHRKAGRKLINIMHGDNAASVLESYFAVDRFYCWAPFYADMFRRQRIAAEFPISANPDLVLGPQEHVSDSGIGVLIPMMNFLPDQFNSLNDLIAAYASQVTRALNGKQATIRNHPAYPWTMRIFMNVAGASYAVSDPKLEKPHDFVLRHRTLIGFYSTVLLEAACLGCNVILIRYPGSDARAKYHYIFRMPNVHHIDLDDLPEFMASFNNQLEAKGKAYGS